MAREDVNTLRLTDDIFALGKSKDNLQNRKGKQEIVWCGNNNKYIIINKSKLITTELITDEE